MYKRHTLSMQIATHACACPYTFGVCLYNFPQPYYSIVIMFAFSARNSLLIPQLQVLCRVSSANSKAIDSGDSDLSAYAEEHSVSTPQHSFGSSLEINHLALTLSSSTAAALISMNQIRKFYHELSIYIWISIEIGNHVITATNQLQLELEMVTDAYTVFELIFFLIFFLIQKFV